jgi:Holliday junction resolvase RusA-like endonuclease
MAEPRRILFAEPDPLRLTVTVLGPAATQGSKTPIRNKIGQAVGSRESSKRSRPWRQDVRGMMADARPEVFFPLDEAVTMTLTVYVSRPRSHFNSKGYLKANAPPFPPSGLDLDKIQRAVGDAAQGIWITNDSRISRWESQRLYCYQALGEVERTVITCELRQA